MRVISQKPLRAFWEQHPDARPGLEAWYEDALRADWKSPTDIKRRYANASVVANNRVVFNIKGNTYRLVVKVHYNRGYVYIRFVGTHAEYDVIDVTTI
jgi:mRNA interferase HigB